MVRAAVGGVRPLAHVPARDESPHVVADRRRRKAGLGREGARRDRLQRRDPAEEGEELLRHAGLLELVVHQQPHEKAGRVELLNEVGLALATGRHVPILRIGLTASSSIK
jgi:hypothetical protein